MKVPELCQNVSSMAEVDPHLDSIMKRCTAGAPWTTVPVGTNTIGGWWGVRMPECRCHPPEGSPLRESFIGHYFMRHQKSHISPLQQLVGGEGHGTPA